MESEQMAKKAKWRRHSVEFKRQAVERMKTCENIHKMALELNVERKLRLFPRVSLQGGTPVIGVHLRSSAANNVFFRPRAVISVHGDISLSMAQWRFLNRTRQDQERGD
jgi:hypothetical protein